jgi:hypothetical protein
MTTTACESDTWRQAERLGAPWHQQLGPVLDVDDAAFSTGDRIEGRTQANKITDLVVSRCNPSVIVLAAADASQHALGEREFL